MQSSFLGTIISGALSVSVTGGSGWSSMFPPRPKWSVDQIPDLTGKVMIVTGGNAGIGRETVKVHTPNPSNHLLCSWSMCTAGTGAVGAQREGLYGGAE